MDLYSRIERNVTCLGARALDPLNTIRFGQRLQTETEQEDNRMMIPGMSQLQAAIKELEDYARVDRSRGELRMVLVTAEEADVLESFREFKTEGY
jgi:hypothetical protein